MNARIAGSRLTSQRLSRPVMTTAEDVVAWFGAVQAQEYHAAKWSIGLRMRGRPTDAAIEAEFNAGRIVRTHIMRPTWHFVAAADLRWLLDLTAARVQRTLANYWRNSGLDERMRVRATGLIARALRDGQHLTRTELSACLARAGISLKGVPMALLTLYAELEGVVCSGSQRGRQSTYALVDHRVTSGDTRSRDEALGELASRYFRSHGPATVRDFGWWSGLTVAEARRAVDIARCESRIIDGLTYFMLSPLRAAAPSATVVHVLPTFDEYFVAYRDLHAVPRALAVGGILPRAVVVNGQSVGTWAASNGRAGVTLDVTLTRQLSPREHESLRSQVARYASFIERPVVLRGVEPANNRRTRR